MNSHTEFMVLIQPAHTRSNVLISFCTVKRKEHVWFVFVCVCVCACVCAHSALHSNFSLKSTVITMHSLDWLAEVELQAETSFSSE